MNYLKIIVTSLLFVVSGSLFAQTIPTKYRSHGFFVYRAEDQGIDIVVFDEKNNMKIPHNAYIDFANFTIESRKWIYQRWGMQEVQFSKYCQVQFVLNDIVYKDVYKQLNRLPIYDSKNGRSAFTISLGTNNKELIESRIREGLSVICVREFEDQHNIKIPNWIVQGMSILNGTPNFIKDRLKDPMVNKDLGYINGGQSIAELIGVSYDDFTSMDADERAIYKSQSAALLLFFQKELYKKKVGNELISVFSKGNFENIIKTYGFNDIDIFDDRFKNYLYNLNYDIVKGKTPNIYLTWFSR